MRGEYGVAGHMMDMDEELPPRARRIPHERSPHQGQHGTTSACAENTPTLVLLGHHTWNYLRVRGEYLQGGRKWLEEEELPPRARRILDGQEVHFAGQGTTSACAENTAADNVAAAQRRNYLRVRGEYT